MGDRPQVVLFDHDGTVVNSLALVVAATNRVVVSQGLEPAPARQIINGMVWPTGIRIGHLVDSHDVVHQAQLADDFYRHARSCAAAHARLYPGMKTLCRRLVCSGWRLGMVTNNEGALARGILRNQGLANYFEVVLGEEDVPAVKPSPIGLRVAARRMRVDPQQVVYVGDSSADAGAARALGVASIGVTWGTHSGNQLADHGFTYLAHDVTSLCGHLSRLRARV